MGGGSAVVLFGVRGDEVNRALALKKTNVSIEVEDATDVAQGAAEISLTLAQKNFQRMKCYVIYCVAWASQPLLFFSLATFSINPLNVMVASRAQATQTIAAETFHGVDVRVDVWRTMDSVANFSPAYYRRRVQVGRNYWDMTFGPE